MFPETQQSPATILIIDDEPVQLRAIVAELNALGFETLIARDGADGLRKAERGRPDLILLDIQMPGWDGYATCRRLKAAPATRAIPVIFLTALCDMTQKLEGFDQREVLARVSAHLQQRRLFARMAEQFEPPGERRATFAGSKDTVPPGGRTRPACASSTEPSTSCSTRWPTLPRSPSWPAGSVPTRVGSAANSRATWG
jgi:CheY-like chemotaxis protein